VGEQGFVEEVADAVGLSAVAAAADGVVDGAYRQIIGERPAAQVATPTQESRAGRQVIEFLSCIYHTKLYKSEQSLSASRRESTTKFNEIQGFCAPVKTPDVATGVTE
jgi:hypothetical protein